ncbi:MAG: DUF1080 domain-containing protein [Planctomycetota bacterium]|nr:MAG: DUF1080 domain-containing protein [Planctomycetota bacterium]
MTTLLLTRIRWAAALAAVFVLAARTACVGAAEPNVVTPEQAAAGWISLFDGETLFGWQPTTSANWQVADGAITVSAGEPGFLMTTSQFADYELHVEFKAPASTNSGVFLRTPLQPANPARDCYELNIAPIDNPFPTGMLVQRFTLKALADDSGPQRDLRTLRSIADAVGGWCSLDVTVSGDKVSLSIFGERVYTYVDPTPLTRGHIGLQFRAGPVAFRNIRLRPVGLQPMLSGRDLAGWNTKEKRASQFTIAEQGELHVTGGSGQLETDAAYGDFTLQFDTRVDGDGLNSGVFFRCIPGEYMQGYECQISNKMIDGDPARPADFGTGAIYRRIPARRIVAQDRQWFTTTINAVGPHIAVWVNGYQVTDWTDTRPANENPRAGLRTAPGAIAIQGHDPTTNLRFRNFRIAELPPRNVEQPNDD